MTAFDSWYTGTAVASGCSPATGTPGATAPRGSSSPRSITGQKRFVIDGEAVVLGVDGVADFNALYFRKHDDELDPISDFVIVPWLDQIARSSSSTPHHFLFR
jgi:hypothetical protein